MNLDLAQIAVEKELKKLAFAIEKKAAKNLWQKITTKEEELQSFYIYGDVGRGKTMLMRNFFNKVHQAKKSYFHFNVFMNSVHEALRDIRSQKLQVKDELILAVEMVVKKSQVICFDEFQVVDIADAMLLSRIFSYIFSKGIIVVFTSNSKPSELYKNGLQRELFLDFVNKVLLKNCKILYLDSETDYREKFCQNLSQRYFVMSENNCIEVRNIIKNFSEKGGFKPAILKVWGREVKVKRASGRVAVFTFDELCKENFAASDYRAICQNFDLIFLLKLPLLTSEEINEARRLTIFIDEVYENKTALIALASCEADKIYSNLVNASWSKRSISRLNEIKSDHYWQSSNIHISKTN
jgi:cell division protein ZapE